MSTTATFNPGDRMCRGRNGWFKPARVWAMWIDGHIYDKDNYLDIGVYSKREGGSAPIILRLSLADSLKLVEVIGQEIEKATGKEEATS